MKTEADFFVKGTPEKARNKQIGNKSISQAMGNISGCYQSSPIGHIPTQAPGLDGGPRQDETSGNNEKKTKQTEKEARTRRQERKMVRYPVIYIVC